jgi:hypothetical protein
MLLVQNITAGLAIQPQMPATLASVAEMPLAAIRRRLRVHISRSTMLRINAGQASSV